MERNQLTPADGPRLSQQTLKVLDVMMANPSSDHYGLEVARIAQLKSGTLYPILVRLEKYGWIEGIWENIDPKVAGRRPRRLYKLTTGGIEASRKVVSRAENLPTLQPGLAL